MNVLSDKKGRKLAVRLDLSIGLFGIIRNKLFNIVLIIGAYTKTVTLMVVASIMSGFCGYSMVIVAYIVLGDFCEDNLRQKGVAILNLFYSFGLLLFCPFYFFLNEWYNVIILFMLIPMIGLVACSFFLLEESPKYLLIK